jgi:hypothetical protein
MNAQDMREFRDYLKACTDRQVQGVYDNEFTAGRDDYAELAIAEAEHRGIELWHGVRQVVRATD